MSKIFCYRCGKENVATATFCSNCGTQMRSQGKMSLGGPAYAPTPLPNIQTGAMVPPPVTNIHYGTPDVYSWKDSPRRLILTLLLVIIIMPILAVVINDISNGSFAINAIVLLPTFIAGMWLIWVMKV